MENHEHEKQRELFKYKRLQSKTFEELRDLRAKLRLGLYKGNIFKTEDLHLIEEVIEEKRINSLYT